MSRAGKIASGLAFCALVGLYLILVFGIQGQIERREEAYAQVESRIATGDYAGALELLEGMDETYRDAKFLTSYAQAHVFYGQGKLGGAKKALAQCDRLLASSEGAPEGFEDFCSKVSAEYLAQVEEEERRHAEAYRERVRTGVPFVGMSEADIANTTLGAPSPEERHNT